MVTLYLYDSECSVSYTVLLTIDITNKLFNNK